MVESLTIELLELKSRGPEPDEELASDVLVRAALDFAWGRIERPWADELAERMGEELADVFFDAAGATGAGADRLELYAGVANRLCDLEEELALGIGSAAPR